MTTPRDLDYRALDTSPSLAARLRAVGRSARLLIGMTLGVLIAGTGAVLVGFLVLVVATGGGTDWTAVVGFGALLLMGLYVVYDALHQAGASSGLAGFAEDNGLVLLTGSSAWDYAGRPFADGDRTVDVAVRTREQSFVEVGDSFEATTLTARDLRDGGAQRTPRAYLRARLAGGAAHDPGESGAHVSRELRDDLGRLLGPHDVEITRSELTVLGSVPLGADPARVREAFRLVDALAAENSREPSSEPDLTIAQEEPPRRRPWVVVLGTLVLVIGVPFAFAAIMGATVPEDGVPGAGGRIIAGVAIVVLVAVAGAGVRFLLVGRRGTADDPLRDR